VNSSQWVGERECEEDTAIVLRASLESGIYYSAHIVIERAWSHSHP
jgi:hypothetical protein